MSMFQIIKNQLFNRIETYLENENYSINHLNINPIFLKTYNGFLLDHKEEKIEYIFERNDVLTYQKTFNDTISVYYLWLNNKMNYYERTFKKVQDVL